MKLRLEIFLFTIYLSPARAFFNKAVGDLPTVHELEKRYIQLILEKTANKKEKAAKILGINRRTLYRKEREYGLVDSNIPFLFRK